nr:hypothetical protein BaRGS_000700 [Batillaria attramentaria]
MTYRDKTGAAEIAGINDEVTTCIVPEEPAKWLTVATDRVSVSYSQLQTQVEFNTGTNKFNMYEVIVLKDGYSKLVQTGDLFECKEDLEDPELWQDGSESPEVQQQSRIDILKIADYIVPGHGPMFQVPSEYRKHIRVVMMRLAQVVHCIVTYTATKALHNDTFIGKST